MAKWGAKPKLSWKPRPGRSKISCGRPMTGGSLVSEKLGDYAYKLSDPNSAASKSDTLLNRNSGLMDESMDLLSDFVNYGLDLVA